MTTIRIPRALPERWVVPGALLAVYAVWGSTYLGIRFMVRSIPPMLGNGVRMLVAGSILFGIMRLRGSVVPAARQWRNGAGVGLFLFVGGLGLVSVAESLGIGSGLAATAVAMMPVWASLVGGLFGQWPKRAEWAGLGIGLAGVVMLSLEGDFRAAPAGLVLVIVAPVLWAFGSVWSNRIDLPLDGMRTALFMLGGGWGLLAAGLLRGERIVERPTTVSVLALLYLIVFGSLVAFSAYGYLLRTVRPALATSYAYVNPVVAVFLGIWLGGESLTGTAWVALPLVVTSVALIARARSVPTEPRHRLR